MKKLKKTGYLFIALLLMASAGDFWFKGHALAATAGILGSRSIKMSTSAATATKVEYLVSFQTGQAASVGGVVIDFCQQDPIPGDTCGGITGFTTSYGTNLTSGAVTATGLTGFSLSASSTTNTLMYTNATPQALGASAPITITLGNGTSTGLTNPSTTNATFYARLFTYSTAAGANAYTYNTPGTFIDAGGIALTTTAQLTITAKVEEQLSLCIYTGANCGAGGTAVTLGNNGVLDVSHAYTNVTAKFQASTNAGSGMVIYGQGTTLTSPAGYTIAAINGGAATAASSSVGSEQFGFCVATSGGSVTATSPYNNVNCSAVTTGQDAAGTAQFAYDTTSTPNMTSLGGDAIASSVGPSATTTGTLAYLANVSPTTKAGVYTTTQTFIGVGTF